MFHEVNQTKLKVSIKTNDFRDTISHRNNGVTNLRETRRIKGTLIPIWQEGAKDIRTPYGLLKLQHLVNQAYGYLVNSLAGDSMTFQSGYIFTRATE